jgi:predicted branched-subunit amino acid permease
VFFILLTGTELAIACLMLTRPTRAVLKAAVVISAGSLLLWLISHTTGLPFGPTSGRPEPLGIPDIVCCAMGIITLVIAIRLLRSSSRLAQRPAGTAHTRWLCLVAIIAASAIGIAGATPAWFEGSDNPSETIMSH